MDRVGFWNIRGLNDPYKQYEVRKFIYQHCFSLFVVVETKVRENNWRKIAENCGYGLSCLHNYDSVSSGKIWCFWDSRKARVRELGQNDQVLHVEVENFALKTTFFLSKIYAANSQEERVNLWSFLQQVSLTVDKPWLICGDFNASFNLEERLSNGDYIHHDNTELTELFSNCELQDLKATGSFYTWCNMRKGSQRQYCKLDRALVNSRRVQSSLVAEAHFGGFEVSDHTLCVITLKADVVPRHRPFRFCEAWVQHPEFFSIVKDAWSIEVQGSHMYRLVQSLKQVKLRLKTLHRGGISVTLTAGYRLFRADWQRFKVKFLSNQITWNCRMRKMF